MASYRSTVDTWWLCPCNLCEFNPFFFNSHRFNIIKDYLITQVFTVITLTSILGYCSPSEYINADNSKQLGLLGNTENYSLQIPLLHIIQNNLEHFVNSLFYLKMSWHWYIVIGHHLTHYLWATGRRIQLTWVTYHDTLQFIWKKLEFSMYLSVSFPANYGIQDAHWNSSQGETHFSHIWRPWSCRNFLILNWLSVFHQH